MAHTLSAVLWVTTEMIYKLKIMQFHQGPLMRLNKIINVETCFQRHLTL